MMDSQLHDALIALDVLGETERVVPAMGASSVYEVATYAFLDGGIFSLVGDPSMGDIPTGTWIFGFSAFRIVIDQMGLQAPRRLLGEPDLEDLGPLRLRVFEERRNATETEKLSARLQQLDRLRYGGNFSTLHQSLAIEAVVDRLGPWSSIMTRDGLDVFGRQSIRVMSMHARYYRDPENPAWDSLAADVENRLDGDRRLVLVVFGDSEIPTSVSGRLNQAPFNNSNLSVARWLTAVDNEIRKTLNAGDWNQ